MSGLADDVRCWGKGDIPQLSRNVAFEPGADIAVLSVNVRDGEKQARSSLQLMAA